MSKQQRVSVVACLEDILDCVDAIQDYVGGMSFRNFQEDGKTQNAVLRRLEVMGEAAGRLLKADDARNVINQLPLREMLDTRNALIPGYDGIDLHVVWRTAIQDVPPLRCLLQEALAAYRRT